MQCGCDGDYEANVNQIEDLQGSITHDIRVSFISWSGWIMDLVSCWRCATDRPFERLKSKLRVFAWHFYC